MGIYNGKPNILLMVPRPIKVGDLLEYNEQNPLFIKKIVNPGYFKVALTRDIAMTALYAFLPGMIILALGSLYFDPEQGSSVKARLSIRSYAMAVLRPVRLDAQKDQGIVLKYAPVRTAAIILGRGNFCI